ncbi:MAG TPA: hypothetical protein VJK51_05270 [Candidatus Nanoarchaeia archaeon]|nr:hypothetical protein [Candidatus Nanoarchaeia archaeon]
MAKKNIKTITKVTPTLRDIARGDVVNLIGIANAHQNERGLVGYSDRDDIGAAVVLVRSGDSIVENVFEPRSQGSAVYIHQSGRYTHAPDSDKYKKFNTQLKEAGL